MEVEFINKVWLQNCGDSLRIIKKSDKKQGSHYSYECEFIKYPCKVIAQKCNIIKGLVRNPQIEQKEFINKIWKQNCGDFLKIIKRSNKRIQRKDEYLGEFYWECEFIKYPYKIFALKGDILKGTINNPLLPWKTKENLTKYIRENFKEKPTLQELAKSLNISYCCIKCNINKFKLKEFITYDCSGEENQVKEFIKSFYNGEVIKYSGKKEDNYYEIDIYFPELKKGIEYNGSPWHEEGNPNNKFFKPIGYHQTKQEFFAKKKIDILFVWDYEWFEDFPKNKVISEQIKQKIRKFLGV